VTSDSIAARVAVVAGAHELVLLKSCPSIPDRPWESLADEGIVDAWFPNVARGLPQICVINFRQAPSSITVP
jgi:hypothetical protein